MTYYAQRFFFSAFARPTFSGTYCFWLHLVYVVSLACALANTANSLAEWLQQGENIKDKWRVTLIGKQSVCMRWQGQFATDWQTFILLELANLFVQDTIYLVRYIFLISHLCTVGRPVVGILKVPTCINSLWWNKSLVFSFAKLFSTVHRYQIALILDSQFILGSSSMATHWCMLALSGNLDFSNLYFSSIDKMRQILC